MSEKVILLVENSLDDEVLTLWVLKNNNILNEVVVADDANEEALEYLFGTGKYKESEASILPRVMLQSDVIFVTSSEENGANSYIHKPVDFGQFIETMKQPGLYWLERNEIPAKRRENRV